MRRRGSLAIGQINAATLANRGLGNYRANSSLTQADFTYVSFSVQRARVRLCTCNNKFFFHLISHSSSRDGKTHNRHTNITSCTCIILGLSTQFSRFVHLVYTCGVSCDWQYSVLEKVAFQTFVRVTLESRYLYVLIVQCDNGFYSSGCSIYLYNDFISYIITKMCVS